MGVFTNAVVADMVSAEKLSWRSISDWLRGIGAIERDAVLPAALGSGIAYVNAMNAIEPGLVRLSEKERRSPVLVYMGLKAGLIRLNVHACGQNIAECIHWSLAPEWTPKDHLSFAGLLRTLGGQRTLGDAGSDDENYVRLQDLIEPDERNALLRRRIDQLQLAHRALAAQCDALHDELIDERGSVEHLHRILERVAIDPDTQLLAYTDVIFAFARADSERAGLIPRAALGDALHTLGIAPIPKAALASLRERTGRGGDELDFATFAWVASVAFVEHLRQQSEREETIASIRKAFDRCDRRRVGLIETADCEHVLRDAGLQVPSDAVRSAMPAKQRSGDDLDLITTVRIWDELVSVFGYTTRLLPEMSAEDRAQRNALRKAFDKYDKDGSGSITKLELVQAFRAAGMSFDAKTVGEVFDKADTDQSGTIDFKDITKLELAQAFRATGMSFDAKTFGEVFNKADTDKSGTIDFKEFLKLSDILSQPAAAAAAPAPRPPSSALGPSSLAPAKPSLSNSRPGGSGLDPPSLGRSTPGSKPPEPPKSPRQDDARRAALRVAFERYDADKSGSITKLELAQAFRAAGITFDAKVISYTFDKADKDASGTISFEEFVGLADLLAKGGTGG
ncbi:hypothetical protein T492DRAFT_1149752 [Pavlovales sp. CCMP2436]|nr:hypothetical protein T492DRAFT_1149752 [Pavlovales sp. CCMP2436]